MIAATVAEVKSGSTIGKISCLQTLLLLFKCANHRNKRPFVSTPNEALVGTLMTIGDVSDIFPISETCLATEVQTGFTISTMLHGAMPPETCFAAPLRTSFS